MHTAKVTSLTQQAEQACFDPADGLLGSIRQILGADQAVLVYASGIGAVAIVPSRMEFFTELSEEQLAAFCRLPAGQYATKRLGEAGVQQLLDQGIMGRNIDELQWRAALYASRGRLLKGCGRDDVVLLKTWPNLTRLPASPNAVRIAALLTRYPTTVSLAHRLLRIPVEEMNEFYSAAHAAGLAVAVNRKPEQPAEESIKPHRQRGLLGQLFERVIGM